MLHITLNTRHAVRLPAELVREDTRRLLLPIINAGGGNLPGQASAYCVQITVDPSAGCAAFTFFRGQEPLTTNVLSVSQDATAQAWEAVESVWLNLGDTIPDLMDHEMTMPVRPSNTPWLATVILPSIAALTRKDIGFIGHMGACFGILLTEVLDG
jgi:hypothetical protein